MPTAQPTIRPMLGPELLFPDDEFEPAGIPVGFDAGVTSCVCTMVCTPPGPEETLVSREVETCADGGAAL